jgi:hypothetical protein
MKGMLLSLLSANNICPVISIVNAGLPVSGDADDIILYLVIFVIKVVIFICFSVNMELL